MINGLFSMMNKKLWIKVLIPVSLSVVLVMGCSLWLSIRAQNRFGVNQLSLRNQVLAEAVEGGMFDALAVGDNDTVRTQFKRLNQKVKDLKVYVYDFNKIVSFSTDSGAVGRSMDAYADQAALKDIKELIDSGNPSGRSYEIRLDDTDYIVRSGPILNEKKCFHCHGSKRKVLGGISVLSSMTDMRRSIDKGRNTTILVSIIGLCLIILLIWMFFSFIVNKKIKLVLEATSRLRQKDFTDERSIARGDEINHILTRINMVSRELRTVVRNIVLNAENLSISSNEMQTIAQTLDASSTDASDKATQVSAAAEQMSVNNEAMSAAMDEAALTMNTLASAVEEMSATVGEISRNSAASKTVTDEVVSGFETILSGVKELGLRADDVDQVTNEIHSISEQVSLLSLNAKIEAARAGDAGKGFAVVAQEITELAANTSLSTVKVDEKLATIKSMVQDMIRQISGIAGKIQESDQAISGIAASVEEQNVTTNEIAKNINAVNLKITDMNDRVNQGAVAAAEIARDITNVKTGASHVKEESQTLNKSAEGLAQMAESLKMLMKEFKI